jgi:hypothetical protein
MLIKSKPYKHIKVWISIFKFVRYTIFIVIIYALRIFSIFFTQSSKNILKSFTPYMDNSKYSDYKNNDKYDIIERNLELKSISIRELH